MHYKNGREAKEGDAVIFPPEYEGGTVRVGTLHSVQSKSDICNGQVATAMMGGVKHSYVNLKDGFHAEDAWKALTVLRGTDQHVVSSEMPNGRT